MRSFLLSWVCIVSLIGGCYGASIDESDETGGGGGAGGASAGSGSGGQARGGRPSGTGGSSSAGTSAGGSSSAGTSAGGSNAGGAGGGIECEVDGSAFPTIDRSCETEADCIAVHHATDCCGSYMVMGINAGAKATFAAAEMECAPLPVCDCAPQWTALEDGTRIPYGDTSYVIACLEAVCQSLFDGETFACGDTLCTEGQYCTLVAGGQPDSGTIASCSSLGDCKSCDCLPASASCGCSQDEVGFITVNCFAP